MFEVLFSIDGLVSLLTLMILEVVLGIDNVIFISIIADKLPGEQQKKARQLGLMLAMLMRIALLFAISWLVGLTKPLFSVGDFHATARDIILFAGGLFLIAKSTTELHGKVAGLPEHEEEPLLTNKKTTLKNAIIQIILLDLVFSFDSILTAVGLVDHVSIMVIAVVFSIAVMLAFAGAISTFINKNPTVKVLALSFLIMIGTLLIADAFHFHVPKGYVYSSLAFSLFVEFLNMKMRKRAEAKRLAK